MTITAPYSELKAHLDATAQASNAFTPLLRDEFDCLSSAESTHLIEITQSKQEATERLLSASTALLNCLEALSLEPDTDSITQWASQWPSTDAQSLLTVWHSLRESLDENDRLHQTNRQLLADLSHRNALQLNLLKNLMGNTDTYSAEGQYRSQSPSGWVDQV
ncbi:MAG: flagellar protein FlgN [Saccharospirillum sp.]|nr:flagellar protein FlgN [Saccharospirillum sp.]